MKPLAIIWNDAHLKTGNEYEVLMSAKHIIEYAVEHGISNLIFAGDLFDNRTFQRQEVLKTFDYILSVFEANNLTLYLFPGNHDKTDYDSEYSFLEVYRYHPCVKFNRTTEIIEIDGVTITLLPFFSDDKLIPLLVDAKPSDVLISHFEMAGSTNLGKVSEKTTITRKMLSKFKKVYLGHFHNHHAISKDIVHLPSLRQASFGEDDDKGFTLLHKDLSYEVIPGKYRAFQKIIINLELVDTKGIEKLVKMHTNSKSIVRFEFVGEESKLKALNREQFKGTGIDVKIKYDKKFNIDEIEMPEVIEVYDEDSVKNTFKTFCEEKEYDYVEGKKLLEEFLNKEK